MDRIKTSGFSLKVLRTKLQRLPLLYRIAGSVFLLAVVLFNSLLMPGCVKVIEGHFGEAEVDGFVLKEVEMENIRFEPQGLPFSIQPAHAYWLRLGDTIAPRWDTHEWHWERKGAMPMCGFVDNTSAGDCLVCDYCNPPPSFDGPPCMGINLEHIIFDPNDFFQVVADSGFIQTDNPQPVLTYTSNSEQILAACSNNTQFPLSFFEPATSGLYRLRSTERMIFKGATNGEIKIHVVEKGEGLAQPTAYPLMPIMVDGANYWKWTIEGSPLWMENFSPNLSVTYVRVFRGRCGDGSAQGKQCDPGESMLVRPSRILFLPDFQNTVSGHPGESSHRCYSNPNASDGNFIKLDLCRERYEYPLNQINPKLTTPTYEPAPAGPLQKLTWLVEFNTLEGADADLREPGIQAMPADAELIIEFTIQAKN